MVKMFTGWSSGWNPDRNPQIGRHSTGNPVEVVKMFTHTAPGPLGAALLAGRLSLLVGR